MVRTYHAGSQRQAVLLYAEDAPLLAGEGWIPVGQAWAEGEWPGAYYLVATLLIIVGIGIVLLIVMTFFKPRLVLVVTYRRPEAA